MSKRLRWSERIAALEQLVAGGGGGGSTGGDGGGGGSTGGLDAAAVEEIVDQKLADLPAPSGGGGSSSGETGVVLELDDELTYDFTLPDGEEFELTLDGILDMDNPPAPPGAVSWAMSQANGARYMMVNSRNDGVLAHQVGPSFYNSVAITQQEYLDYVAANPGSSAFHYDYGAGGPPYYHVAVWNNAWGGAPSGWSGDNLAGFNSALTAFGFPAWPDASHPARADIEQDLSIVLLPNGESANTDSVFSGSDVGSDSDSGLLIARAVSGHTWRLLAKSTLVTRVGEKRIVAGQSIATLGDKRKTHIVGGTWDDTTTEITHAVLDFDGGLFNGKLAIVPKAVVSA